MQKLNESFFVNKQHESCCQPTHAAANLLGSWFKSRNIREDPAASALALIRKARAHLEQQNLEQNCWTISIWMRLIQSIQTLVRFDT